MAKTYAIADIFITVQGEGLRTGARSVFVRFAGCNIWNGKPADRDKGKASCAKWCDTDFATPKMRVDHILLEHEMTQLWGPARSTKWCVLTGGEPGLQIDQPLVDYLRRNGWRIAVETNGTAVTNALLTCDHITLSPKIGQHSAADMPLPMCTELKVVLPGDPDSPWSDDELTALGARYTSAAKYVQPQDPINPGFVNISHLSGENSDEPTFGRVQYRANVKRCLAFVHSHPSWRLSLQTHKLVGMP